MRNGISKHRALKKVTAFLLMLGCSFFAHASTALLLEEPFGLFGHLNPTGHAAIYLDHICAQTPTSLRPCRDGEFGAVISRYHKVDGYDWVAIPLIPYLYAVETLDQVPTTATAALQRELRDQYRRTHLLRIAPDKKDGSTPGGEWIQLVGSAYDRKLYGFQLESTPEQDADIIAEFNDSRNVAHFNIIFRNCADFSRKFINREYPGAIHRNFIADIGITTPKQVARSLVRFSNEHPEVPFSTFVIPQVPGTIQRSRRVDGVTESIVRSKKYVVPLAVIAPIPTAVIAAAWLAGGRLQLPDDEETLAVLRQPASRSVHLMRRQVAPDSTPADPSSAAASATPPPTVIAMPTPDASSIPITLGPAE
ncbi:hypothetical protein AciPR4_1780 [Terriglobus saanensis SP1PR4]|uniref:DUF4105 domain-containing protein n=1 Tax=Terriglobus saanensis (strain ATCC BAA-1853 / DSM 23119 / SP1PR4) TaxID=401053 RepID=E8V4V8_TERSS|nr:hypothetical protein AciPR4_1780 [Terriglobus saanensis SP1PR4]